MPPTRKFFLTIAIFTLGSLLTGCNSSDDSAQNPAGASQNAAGTQGAANTTKGAAPAGGSAPSLSNPVPPDNSSDTKK